MLKNHEIRYIRSINEKTKGFWIPAENVVVKEASVIAYSNETELMGGKRPIKRFNKGVNVYRWEI